MFPAVTVSVTAKDENSLRIFERQILRKIFGPGNIHNIWRIRNNMEIDKITEGTDIVRFINTLRTGDADLRFYITTVQDG